MSSLFKITDKIHITFGILVHQGHTKIIIIITIEVIILNNQTIISNMTMMMMTKNSEDIPTGDLPIGLSSVGISFAHHPHHRHHHNHHDEKGMRFVEFCALDISPFHPSN